nr:MAG TPA: hypothetical protein [Caudoviricetes sp.]
MLLKLLFLYWKNQYHHFYKILYNGPKNLLIDYVHLFVV